MIYLIYAPTERDIAVTVAQSIEAASTHQCQYAPLGYPVDGDEWKQLVTADMDKSHAAVVIVTRAAAMDESVRWRIQYAQEKQMRLITLMWDYMPDQSIITEVMPELMYMQYIPTSEDTLDKWAAQIVANLPVSSALRCFVSYSRKDSELVDRLVSDLRAASVQTWRDKDDIPAGANWDREIEQAIRECTHLLLVASPDSVASENVMDEVSLAINTEKTVVPVMIADCDLPMRVHRAQWVDFRPDYEQGMAKLLQRLGVTPESH